MKSSAFALPLLPCLALPLAAEVESDLKLGLEAVTGFRSEYVQRGFSLSDALLDFQLEGEVALDDTSLLNFGGWFASEISDDFGEAAAFLDFSKDLAESITIGASASYHSYDNSFFEDGIDVGTSLTWFGGEEWDLSFHAHRDFGAEAWYANVEGGWSRRLSDEAFLSVTTGLSWVDDYYGSSGLHDYFGRVSVTYNINSMISVTPFVGWSLEIDDGDGDQLYGGLWFEVSF